MQNLLTAAQMQNIDAYTIKHKKIKSVDLMEQAANAFVNAFISEFEDENSRIAIFCGKGNNGGDGLAIARLLLAKNYKNISVFLTRFGGKQSDDNLINLKRLQNLNTLIKEINDVDEIGIIEPDCIIDAVLGSGLNKPLTDQYAALAKLINDLNVKVIAVDVPTGFNGEGQIPPNYNGVEADLVICFQLPKVNFFFPESVVALNRFKIVAIGLDEDFINLQLTDFKLVEHIDAAKLIRPRAKFTHKGTYGHALIIAGNTNTMGAALLAASSCLHSGAGLTTVCLPQSGLTALNMMLPEAMALPREKDFGTIDFEKYKALAIGPGLGVENEEIKLLEMAISKKKPFVVDADALSLLSYNKDLLEKLTPNTILTPHLKEFDRLFGDHENWWQRVETAKAKAKELAIVIVLKNQYTFICMPTGEVCINQTGNPAMASGGMGDVLTGLIVSLLAQGYEVKQAAILGVYLHGKSGDDLAEHSFCITASQVALQLPKTMKMLMD
ncbi:MAG: NAD(P)H-hydrate dehydratase [Flavobacterium sp.]|nr:MAG: NAD(P)H-hydrate dehydratase [Flavobacterium sp.]